MVRRRQIVRGDERLDRTVDGRFAGSQMGAVMRLGNRSQLVGGGNDAGTRLVGSGGGIMRVQRHIRYIVQLGRDRGVEYIPRLQRKHTAADSQRLGLNCGVLLLLSCGGHDGFPVLA